MTNYPFVISSAAQKIIAEHKISYEDVVNMPKEFDNGGIHTFLLKSDILGHVKEKESKDIITKKGTKNKNKNKKR